MDVVSAISSVIALYQLTTEITKICIKYGQEVRQGSREMRLFMDGITQFQICIARLAQPLENEGSSKGGEDRLRFLRDVVNEESQSYKDLLEELDALLKQLDKALSREGLRRQVSKLTWPLKADDRRRVIERMHVIEAAITKAVTLDSNELLRTIDSRLKATEKVSNERQTRLDEEQKERDELDDEKRKRKDILAWLRHPSPSENHDIACAVRNDGIHPGRWLLEGAELKEHCDLKRSLLWLHGYGGCGKTILSSLLIDHFAKECKHNSDQRLAYWYFNGNDRQRMSMENVLRCLVTQLMPPEPSKVPKILTQIWQNRGQGQTAPKLSDLSLSLRRMLLEYKNLVYYLVIDALDESRDDPGDRENLFNVLSELLSDEELSIHIVITSRTQEDISKLFEKLPECRRSIAIEDQVDRDIEKHVESQLEIIQAQNHWRDADRDRTQKALLDKADGM